MHININFDLKNIKIKTMKIENKIFIVTGAGSGIGRELRVYTINCVKKRKMIFTSPIPEGLHVYSNDHVTGKRYDSDVVE